MSDPTTSPTDSTSAPEPAELDVVGIGNALVDVIGHGTDDAVAELGVEKGSMTLVDEERSAAIYSAMGPAVEISGGSAANTVVGVAAFGGAAQYVGKVRDDQLGAVFAHDLRATGVRYEVPPAPSGPSSGRCLVLVTPDAQRTMSTYLGASVHLGPDDIDPEVIQRGRVLYLEGYLFDPPEAQEAFRVAAQIAHDAGRTVSLTLSDSFCVDRHRDAFVDLVRNHVDLVFANEDEICSLFEVDEFDAAVGELRGHGAIAALTRSERGSVVVTEDDVVTVAAHPPATLADTTGAGDLYAAGFLFGYSRGRELATCGALGSLAAAEVISHVGARPQADLAELAHRVLGVG